VAAQDAQSVRRRVWELLEVTYDEADHKSTFDWVDISLFILIVLNVAVVIIESVPGVEKAYWIWFAIFNTFSLVVFSIEYAVRLWACSADARYSDGWRGRLRWMVTPMGFIDLFAILPSYLVILFPGVFFDMRFMRILRIGRLFRVLKLGRYSESLNRIGRVVKAKRSDLAASVFFIVVLIIIASSLMFHAENTAQPDKYSSIPATMWWSVSALTTVGYGDIYPITAWGKVLASVIAVLGVGLFALPTGILASGFAEEARRERAARNRCPHCGKSLATETESV